MNFIRKRSLCCALALACFALSATGAPAQNADLEASYRYLLSDRDASGGALYKATTGVLQDRVLPLSFYDSAAYWAEHVCNGQKETCAVVDSYSSADYTLTPQRGPAGDLQTERVNTHNGTNIYDAATWQMAVMLGAVVNKFGNSFNPDAYQLANAQNLLLKEGYSGNARSPLQLTNRAITAGPTFRYNDRVILSRPQAYAFRMISRSWLSSDPFVDSAYASWVTASALPIANPEYKVGKVSWTDWKPITGENAWAFLLGPLQAAYIHYVQDKRATCVPFNDLAVQNALAVLPTFAAMQSWVGGVYSVPSGTLDNQGTLPMNPHKISLENSFSLYAGLRVLESTLRVELTGDKTLSPADRKIIDNALQTLSVMIGGGQMSDNQTTVGLLEFFRTQAWRDNQFVQAGLANDPAERSTWVAWNQPKAVDVNTWGIAALGTRQIDQWFGFGAAYKNWQQLKQWGAYGVGKKLWGVGYSDQDGDGVNTDGSYRQGILSAEWTAGAINTLRNMISAYGAVAAGSPDYAAAQSYLRSLREDEGSMLEALPKLRIDNYLDANFIGKPANYAALIRQTSKPYLYASRRYLIPFGWYANPLPSTCATAWAIMLADRFDPFGYGGRPN
jgi:hypothetical protein